MRFLPLPGKAYAAHVEFFPRQINCRLSGIINIFQKKYEKLARYCGTRVRRIFSWE